jgi:hypothetical protein
MKSEVYSWRLSEQLKSELEAEARREGKSMATMLCDVAVDWLRERRDGRGDEDAEQVRLQAALRACVGSIRGGNPQRSQQAREVLRARIKKAHRRS